MNNYSITTLCGNYKASVRGTRTQILQVFIVENRVQFLIQIKHSWIFHNLNISNTTPLPFELNIFFSS